MSSIRDFLITGLTGNNYVVCETFAKLGEGINMSITDLCQLIGKGLLLF
ncbi:MAG: hypothetical protein ABF649_17080 [Bacillus sp. (in: firmicutes)]